MPLVSVIVPNYNHAAFLKQRLESIFAQTYKDYEVIILDDCSTDNSREVINQYKNYPQVSHVIFNEKNSGSPFKQWRKGLELACGEWIWIAESDDYCTTDLLNQLVGKIDSHENIVLSYCQSHEVNERGEGHRTMIWHTDKVDTEYWKKDYFNTGTGEIKKSLWYINSIPNASAVLFKKNAYLQADKSFETMKMCGDWMLWAQLLKTGNIAFTAAPHNFFRKHDKTTRVFENIDKRKMLAEEEYMVAKDIQRSIAGISYRDVKNKIGRIIKNYCSLYSTTEIKKYLLHPGSYQKPIPLAKFVRFYFTRLMYVKVKKLVARN